MRQWQNFGAGRDRGLSFCTSLLCSSSNSVKRRKCLSCVFSLSPTLSPCTHPHYHHLSSTTPHRLPAPSHAPLPFTHLPYLSLSPTDFSFLCLVLGMHGEHLLCFVRHYAHARRAHSPYYYPIPTCIIRRHCAGCMPWHAVCWLVGRPHLDIIATPPFPQLPRPHNPTPTFPKHTARDTQVGVLLPACQT